MTLSTSLAAANEGRPWGCHICVHQVVRGGLDRGVLDTMSEDAILWIGMFLFAVGKILLGLGVKSCMRHEGEDRCRRVLFADA